MCVKAYLFWSLLCFIREYRKNELHSRLIVVVKTTMRHWAVALPNRTIGFNLLNIHMKENLYKYREIKHPCTTFTQRANLFVQQSLCGDKQDGVYVCALACERHSYINYGLKC